LQVQCPRCNSQSGQTGKGTFLELARCIAAIFRRVNPIQSGCIISSAHPRHTKCCTTDSGSLSNALPACRFDHRNATPCTMPIMTHCACGWESTTWRLKLIFSCWALRTALADAKRWATRRRRQKRCFSIWQPAGAATLPSTRRPTIPACLYPGLPSSVSRRIRLAAISPMQPSPQTTRENHDQPSPGSPDDLLQCGSVIFVTF